MNADQKLTVKCDDCKKDIRAAASERESAEGGRCEACRAQDARFQALRAWRVEQARAKQVPPYIVATDAVLLAVAAADPCGEAQLASVRGFGPAKVAAHGDELLALLAKARAAPAPQVASRTTSLAGDAARTAVAEYRDALADSFADPMRVALVELAACLLAGSQPAPGTPAADAAERLAASVREARYSYARMGA